MLSSTESIGIVIAIVAGSIAFLGLLHRIWPSEQRRLFNELIGWQVTVLGTTYAVIVGFMLYAVWTTFELADANAEAEANSLVNTVRASRGLPVAAQEQIQNLARQYVDIMLTQEWPAMAKLSVSPASHQVIAQLWRMLLSVKINNAAEQTSLDHAITELSKMTEYRRTRQLQVKSSLPDILWGVLIVGAIVTIVSACLFGSVDIRLHLIQVFMLSLLISLALVAIADINRPFQGSVHVAPSGFENARATLTSMAPIPH